MNITQHKLNRLLRDLYLVNKKLNSIYEQKNLMFWIKLAKKEFPKKRTSLIYEIAKVAKCEYFSMFDISAYWYYKKQKSKLEKILVKYSNEILKPNQGL